MSAFFKWASQHIALTFFLGVEILTILVGTTYFITLSLKDDAPDNVSQPPVIVLTLPEYRELLATELDKFGRLEELNYLIETVTIEEAVQRFATTDDLSMLLPENVESFELDQMFARHSHLKKEVFTCFDVNDRPVNLLYIFYWNDKGQEERIAAFFKTENAHHVVFQPARSVVKKPVRNG